MFNLSLFDFILTMAVCLFVMGLLAMGAGIYIISAKAMGGDLRTIARQTAQLAQKGIADDIAGLVGNATVLIDSLNQMVQTTSGIGMFLFFCGLALVMLAYFLVQQII